jgi:Tfp pilus assembly protein PilV
VRRLMDQRNDEQGSILLEALVSGILLVITAVGVFSAFDAGTRASAEERHRAQAEGIAQTDLTRMRTMRISDLSNLHESKVLTIEKTPYTIESDAEYETDKTGTASCVKGTASADYIQIRSTITWPSLGSRAPVVEQSLVAPPNGSVSEHSGSLAIQVENAKNEGIEGVGLTGTGAGTFSGETGETGCVVFGDLPEGNYTLTPTISGTSLVDPNGVAPGPQSTSVVGESTNTLALQYDEAGEATAKFTTTVGGKLVPSKADAIVAFNSGMKVARVFGTPGTRQEEVTAKPLFPFASAYSIYAGTCNEDNPGESAPDAAIGEVEVPPGGKASVTIELPPLNLTAWSGKSSKPGEPVANAQVTVTDTKCSGKGAQVLNYTTEANGHLAEPGLPHLADPGLPYSTYEVCVSNGTKRIRTPNLAVPPKPEELEAGTTLSVFLGSSKAESGKCP